MSYWKDKIEKRVGSLVRASDALWESNRGPQFVEMINTHLAPMRLSYDAVLEAQKNGFEYLAEPPIFDQYDFEDLEDRERIKEKYRDQIPEEHSPWCLMVSTTTERMYLACRLAGSLLDVPWQLVMALSLDVVAKAQFEQIFGFSQIAYNPPHVVPIICPTDGPWVGSTWKEVERQLKADGAWRG